MLASCLPSRFTPHMLFIGSPLQSPTMALAPSALPRFAPASLDNTAHRGHGFDGLLSSPPDSLSPCSRMRSHRYICATFTSYSRQIYSDGTPICHSCSTVSFYLARHGRRRSQPCWTSCTAVSICPSPLIRPVQSLIKVRQFLVLLSLIKRVVYWPLLCSTASLWASTS